MLGNQSGHLLLFHRPSFECVYDAVAAQLKVDLCCVALSVVKSFNSDLRITMVDHNVVFGEWVFILKDIGLGMVMAFYMTRSRALPFLVKIRPTATLLGIRTLSTIATQVAW